jgi:hypothetical protein
LCAFADQERPADRWHELLLSNVTPIGYAACFMKAVTSGNLPSTPKDVLRCLMAIQSERRLQA